MTVDTQSSAEQTSLCDLLEKLQAGLRANLVEG